MNELQKVFNYGEQQVRTVIIDDVVWFIAADVCTVLDIKNSHDAVVRLDADEKATSVIPTQFGDKEMNLVNESGLYSLIFRSRKKEAKQFKRWVTHEVLPSIRKNGSYNPQVPQSFSEALRLAADLQEEAERNRPKVEAHDRFISGENYQTMSIAAKSLGTGRNKLFKFLKQKKILMSNNTPYQTYIDRGYFVVKEKPIQMGGQVINKPQTYVTPKGVDYLDRLLQQEAG
ncbi:Phage antirepressor protein KilAC domain-containing protein [Thalassobacillus cyri]|uniref:Phage antirepressor protein KilAC domain-containing protein n=1 Tax=Thalassobacillus cyri TaxID=571932 RepID=A0A1H4H4F8_9BACI|nr:phage antirepressor [Thalassobacillus cyri]SEB15958.1 Phage antirepressor protein KilAC domain-containing protein [Thalassobacillus cyri]